MQVKSLDKFDDEQICKEIKKILLRDNSESVKLKAVRTELASTLGTRIEIGADKKRITRLVNEVNDRIEEEDESESEEEKEIVKKKKKAKKRKRETKKVAKMEPKKKKQKTKDAFEISDSGNKRVTCSHYGGTKRVDLRVYYQKDGEWKPTKKGISLNVNEWDLLRSGIEDIQEMVDST